NLFDPANGSRYHFTWHNLKGVDFKAWQAAQGKNKHATFDPHSKEDVVEWVDALNHNFHLKWNSPAIDAGRQDIMFTTDFDGLPIYGTPDIGPFEYQPPYIMGDDPINTQADIRIYADGKFRNTKKPNGITCDMLVSPISGFDPHNYAHWADIKVLSWNTDGNYKKMWVQEKVEPGRVDYTIGDFKPGAPYAIYCGKKKGKMLLLGIKVADASGKIAFQSSTEYRVARFSIEPSPKK
ncbi:MAG: hypothetical protein MI717_05695, partial [Spirochaetales bacterium]|nr:hypothetical protein [Spirochaetales bacterium]